MKNQEIKKNLEEILLIIKNKFNEIQKLKPNNKIIDIFETMILNLEKEIIRLKDGKNC